MAVRNADWRRSLGAASGELDRHGIASRGSGAPGSLLGDDERQGRDSLPVSRPAREVRPGPPMPVFQHLDDPRWTKG